VLKRLSAFGVLALAAICVAGASPSASSIPAGEIVFSARPAYTQLFATDANRPGPLIQVTHAFVDEPVFAAWSPIGDTVAYSTYNGTGIAASDGTWELDDQTDDATQIRPSWAPDGRWIASTRYAGGLEVWVAHPDGSDAHRLGPGASPTWSPDGTSIAAGDGNDVVIYDASSGARRTVAAAASVVSLPEWSPDGTRIAYVETPDSGAPLVHVVGSSGQEDKVIGTGSVARWSPDGTRLAVLRPLAPGAEAALLILRPDGSLLAELARDALFQLSWSPDGAQLAYVTASLEKLNVVAADGTSYRTAFMASPGGAVTDVAWAPAGSRLLFAYSAPRPNSFDAFRQLFAVDPVTRRTRQLTHDEADHDEPGWARNGLSLAFARNGTEVVVASDDLMRSAVVARGDEPALSTNGSRLAFHRGGRIFTATATGAHVRSFARGAWPAWSPDGHLIAYLRGGALWTRRSDRTHPRRLLGRPPGSVRFGPPAWFGDRRHVYVPLGSQFGGVVVTTGGRLERQIDFSDTRADFYFYALGSSPSADGRAFVVALSDSEDPEGPGCGCRNALALVPADGGAASIILRTLSPSAAWLFANPGEVARLAWRPEFAR
jgi:Tol biopolymer transport system component